MDENMLIKFPNWNLSGSHLKGTRNSSLSALKDKQNRQDDQKRIQKYDFQAGNFPLFSLPLWFSHLKSPFSPAGVPRTAAKLLYGNSRGILCRLFGVIQFRLIFILKFLQFTLNVRNITVNHTFTERYECFCKFCGAGAECRDSVFR